MRITFFILFVAAFTVGCTSHFSGSFEFRNRSNTELFVSVSGFERNPPVGILSTNYISGSSMDAMPIPAQAIITWSETHDIIIKPEHGSSFSRAVLNQPNLICFSPVTNGQSISTMANEQKFTQTISMLSISNFSPNAEIIFEYQSNHVWKVFCEPL
jgi:hypothetical protein